MEHRNQLYRHIRSILEKRDAMGHNFPQLSGSLQSECICLVGRRTNNEALIRLEEALPGTNYERAARYYSYGQFTKFIPEGSRRVDVKTIAPENDEEVFPKELLMTAYVKDDTYTIVLVNNSTSKAFETKLEIEGKEFQTMISYTSDEGVKWQRKKVNPSLTGLRAITVPKFSVVTITGKMKDIGAE